MSSNAVTIKHKFRAKGHIFPQGATGFTVQDLLDMKITETEITQFYDAGWVDIEGHPPGPDADPNRRVKVRPKPLKFGTKATKAGG